MRKLITFDIDTNVAAAILGDYRKIYRHMKKFFLKNDFSWQQGSTYISNSELSHLKVLSIVKGLYREFPYIKKCIRDMVVSDVGRKYSLNNLGSYDGTPGQYTLGKTINTSNGPIPAEEFKDYVFRNSNPQIIRENKGFIRSRDDYER